MKLFQKWLSSFLAFIIIFQLTISASANTSRLPIYYQDQVKSICDRCDADLYTASNGIVYQIFYQSSKITAINNGQKLWTFKLPKSSSLVYKTKTVADRHGNLYIGYQKDQAFYLASLNSKGKVKWEFKLDLQMGPGTPLIAQDGTVYFGTGNPFDYDGPKNESAIYAVSELGKKQWRVSLKGDLLGEAPKFDQSQNIVIATKQGQIYTISKSGKLISTIESDALESFVSNEFFIDSKYLIALDSEGKTLWKYKVKEGAIINSVTDKGTVYILDGGILTAVSKGKTKWKLKIIGDIIVTEYGIFNMDNSTENMIIKVLNEKNGKVRQTKILDSNYYQYSIQSEHLMLISRGNIIYKVDL